MPHTTFASSLSVTVLQEKEVSTFQRQLHHSRVHTSHNSPKSEAVRCVTQCSTRHYELLTQRRTDEFLSRAAEDYIDVGGVLVLGVKLRERSQAYFDLQSQSGVVQRAETL